MGKRHFKLATSRSGNDNKMRAELNGGSAVQFVLKGMKYANKNASVHPSQLEEKRNASRNDERRRLNFSTGKYSDNKSSSPPLLNYSEETRLDSNSSWLWNFNEAEYDLLEYDNSSDIDSHHHLLHQFEYFFFNDTDIIDIINKSDAHIKHKEPSKYTLYNF